MELSVKPLRIMNVLSFFLIATTLFSCTKFLGEKPNEKLTIPSNLSDLQALLDAYPVMNSRDMSAGEISADDYYLTISDWDDLREEGHKRMYVWEKDMLFTYRPNDWQNAYSTVYYANSVLQELARMTETADNEYRNIKGQALFFRARSFQQLAFHFAVAYDQAEAATDLGIPLRLNPDFNEASTRSNVQATYEQIIKDLQESIPLLPVTPLHVMRPSRPAAYALLARTCLAMRKYDEALRYADSCLQLKNELLDYNTLDTTAPYPVPEFNIEIIMLTYTPPPRPLGNARAKIDSVLYESYDEDDLRRLIFFRDNNNGTFGFKGSYHAVPLFTGIATDEVYLMRAECYARQGNVAAAMKDLNFLLKHRYNEDFSPVTANDAEAALEIILKERRKELLMRGLRWVDIKRLNREGANITLQRVINNETFTLPPNDLRYALPVPEDVIELSGMPQNPR